MDLTIKAYSNIESNVSDITLTRLFEISEILGCTPEYIINYQERATFTNHFNNYEGNKGINIMYQGCTPEQVKNLEHQLQNSQDNVQALREKVIGRNN